MSEKKERKLLGVAIISMIVAAIILSAVLVVGVRRVGRENSISSFREFISARRVRGPLPATDDDLIRSWMTFDYINHLFSLPVNYLKTELNVNDSRYPNISLYEYGESLSTSTVSLLDTVRSAVLKATTTQQ